MDNFKEYLKDAQGVINESTNHSNIITAKRMLAGVVESLKTLLRQAKKDEKDEKYRSAQIKKVTDAGKEINDAIKVLQDINDGVE